MESFATHTDLDKTYVLTKDDKEAYRFDGKDVAVLAAKMFRLNSEGDVNRHTSYSTYAAKDGNGMIVMYFTTTRGQPTLHGYLMEAPAKPSISLLYEAINEHRAAVSRVIASRRGNVEETRADLRVATDQFVAKLTAWGVSDKFDLSDLYE